MVGAHGATPQPTWPWPLPLTHTRRRVRSRFAVHEGLSTIARGWMCVWKSCPFRRGWNDTGSHTRWQNFRYCYDYKLFVEKRERAKITASSFRCWFALWGGWWQGRARWLVRKRFSFLAARVAARCEVHNVKDLLSVGWIRLWHPGDVDAGIPPVSRRKETSTN